MSSETGASSAVNNGNNRTKREDNRNESKAATEDGVRLWLSEDVFEHGILQWHTGHSATNLSWDVLRTGIRRIRKEAKGRTVLAHFELARIICQSVDAWSEEMSLLLTSLFLDVKGTMGSVFARASVGCHAKNTSVSSSASSSFSPLMATSSSKNVSSASASMCISKNAKVEEEEKKTKSIEAVDGKINHQQGSVPSSSSSSSSFQSSSSTEKGQPILLDAFLLFLCLQQYHGETPARASPTSWFARAHDHWPDSQQQSASPPGSVIRHIFGSKQYLPNKSHEDRKSTTDDNKTRTVNERRPLSVRTELDTVENEVGGGIGKVVIEKGRNNSSYAGGRGDDGREVHSTNSREPHSPTAPSLTLTPSPRSKLLAARPSQAQMRLAFLRENLPTILSIVFDVGHGNDTSKSSNDIIGNKEDQLTRQQIDIVGLFIHAASIDSMQRFRDLSDAWPCACVIGRSAGDGDDGGRVDKQDHIEGKSKECQGKQQKRSGHLSRSKFVAWVSKNLSTSERSPAVGLDVVSNSNRNRARVINNNTISSSNSGSNSSTSSRSDGTSCDGAFNSSEGQRRDVPEHEITLVRVPRPLVVSGRRRDTIVVTEGGVPGACVVSTSPPVVLQGEDERHAVSLRVVRSCRIAYCRESSMYVTLDK